MSYLQDLIANNAVKAYNEGFERGEASERERIIKIAKNRICFDYLEKPEYCDDPACYALADLIDKIKGEQK